MAGSAAIEHSELSLSRDDTPWSSSAAYYPSKLRLDGPKGFEIRFSFTMGGGSFCAGPTYLVENEYSNVAGFDDILVPVDSVSSILIFSAPSSLNLYSFFLIISHGSWFVYFLL